MNRIIKKFISFRKEENVYLSLNEEEGTAGLSKNLEKRRQKAETELKKKYPGIKGCKIDTTPSKDGNDDLSLVCQTAEGEEIKTSFHGTKIGGSSSGGATGSASFGSLGDVLAAGVKYLGASKTSDPYYRDREEYYSKPGEDERSRTLKHLGVDDSPDDGSVVDNSSDKAYRSGVDSESAKSLLANTKRKGSVVSSENIKIPAFSKIGSLGFSESTEYEKILASLDLIKRKKKNIIKSLRKIGLPEEAEEMKDFIVAVRSPLSVKNKFGRDFTDLFICFNEDVERPDFYLGSTTPSPIFKFEEDRNSLISLGFIGLLNQGGPLIINPTSSSPYIFSKEEDEVFGGCFLQKSDVSCQRYEIDNRAGFRSYEPGSSKRGDFGLFFRSANMDGDSAEGLDATTYGDLVIKNKKDFASIFNRYKNVAKIYILELPELSKSEETEVNESRNGFKYISRFS
jgi:hypothetical protein